MTQPPFPALCRTTAMGIMPHKDIRRALELALSLDIPFWPQLPNTSFYEDMYVQASDGFPGITVDLENRKLNFDRQRFEQDISLYSVRMEDPAYFSLSAEYSRVYRRFLGLDLREFAAIRGQNIGPVSFGFRVTDADNRPIIYDDGIRSLMFDFMQKKVNAQHRELVGKNPNAFVWLDEPGLGWVFSGLAGFSDVQAGLEYRAFLDGIEGVRALHLCANVNLPYLLGLGVKVLSFDAFQMEIMPKGYARAVADYVGGGGIICWGIVPTDSVSLDAQTPEKLVRLLRDYWGVVAANSGVAVKQLAEQSLLAPARCCLKNVGRVGAAGEVASCGPSATRPLTEEQLVEKAFGFLGEMSGLLRGEFGL